MARLYIMNKSREIWDKISVKMLQNLREGRLKEEYKHDLLMKKLC